MFDALLKTKFYLKCKSEMKMTMRRMEIIKRKRNAVQKFLRNDVADLLTNGLYTNAYDRVEQLFADQNLSWCYEFVEESCVLIISRLSSMSKQRECPEECMEAIPTLMFAAARFADLPELRELRSIFYERYENHLEPYVNQEFVKNLKAHIPTKEIRLQMMEEIAMEYGIEWDSKVFEQKLCKPPPFIQDFSQFGNGRSNESDKTHNQTSSKTKIQETEKEKTEVAMGQTLTNGPPYNSRAETEEKEEKPIGNGLPYKSRAEIEAEKERKHDHGRLSPYWSSNTSTCSESTTSPDDSASEDTPEETKFYVFGSTRKSTISDTSDDGFQSDIPERRKLNGLRSMGPPYTKPNISKKTDDHKSEEETEKISKPVPRSVRVRRPLKPVSGSIRANNDVSNDERHDFDNGYRDEQEKKADKLSSPCRKASQLPTTTRTGSLPSEPVAAGLAVDERKGLARAVTYQPESGLGPRGHVHPKLPDYDEFVARLAALRASS
ncbi:putative vacuolar protein sorting-associated protein Ist1 [Helianthus annuus]|nr:putative vacuolar protein sorting-associated protein Ist1 [Helianthus annuus]